MRLFRFAFDRAPADECADTQLQFCGPRHFFNAGVLCPLHNQQYAARHPATLCLFGLLQPSLSIALQPCSACLLPCSLQRTLACPSKRASLALSLSRRWAARCFLYVGVEQSPVFVCAVHSYGR